MNNSRYIIKQIALPLIINIIAGFILYHNVEIDFDRILLISIALFLVFIIVYLVIKINYLFYLLSISSTTKTSNQEILISDILTSLRKYGYIKSFMEEKNVKLILSSGKYIRGQNFYFLMERGLIKSEKNFRFINDHPFKPFAELVTNHLDKKLEITGINAIPDNFYSKEDINNRIKIVKTKEANYFLLPKEDVHLSMLIYDDEFCVVYPTPENRTVCCFSEAIFFSSSKGVKEFIKIFDHVVKIAKRNSKTTNEAILQLEKNKEYFIGL